MSINYKEYFKGKKVTIMGLGLLGRGLNDAIFLSENGAEVIVTDLKSEAELKPSLEKLKDYKNITYTLGEHKLTDFEKRDFILKAAGVPIDSPYIAYAKEEGIPVEMDSALFAKLCPPGVVIIGITGTRGKSTTTHLIYNILKEAGKGVFLGGNVRDMATLPLLEKVKEGDCVVLELDSWQLQGFGEAGISPHVAVFTTFMSDHLNYYSGNLELYFEDKSNIYKFQKEGDFLIVGEGVRKIESRGKEIIAKGEFVPKDWAVKIRGIHNLLNISCGIEATRALGLSDEEIKKGVESFLGVEGRLQFVMEKNGVKIYNDNNATTPQASIAGMEALFDKQNIVLICGGADKGLDLHNFVEELNKTCKEIILLPGTGSEKLKSEGGEIKVPITNVNNLNEAVKIAFEKAVQGDYLLFSPAFASFGQYNNEYERNDEFMKLIKVLQ